jgi:uncharacterized iron-regulated membrane protein
MSNSTRLRAIWWTLHRWFGLGLALLLAPIAMSGALLVCAEQQGGGEGSRDGAVWRVQLRNAESGEIATVTVDDRSGAVERLPGPLAGDRAAQWIRRIHEGSHSGPVWQFVVFLTGCFPLVFAVAGVIMWWRGRRSRREVAAGRAAGRGGLQAAE